MGVKPARGRLLGRRSKLHYGECSEQAAGWSGGAAGCRERQLFWGQPAQTAAASWENWLRSRWVSADAAALQTGRCL